MLKPPSSASVVIIGGGVVGLSSAYQLARSGVRNVVLLDRGALGSGSTCKAAGGVRAQFSDPVNIALGARGLETFGNFAALFGQEIDFHQVGYLFLLGTPEAVAAFEASVAVQNDMGIPSRMIGVDEARRMSPLINTDGLLAAAYSSTDGDTSFYFHGEGQGLLLGMSDPDETPGFKLDRSDAWLPRLGEIIERRAPALTEIGIASGWAGLYEMTPDHNALVGRADQVENFLYATGFSGHGFLMGPAVGEVLRDLYLGRQPFVDIARLSAGRFAHAGGRPELNIV